MELVKSLQYRIRDDVLCIVVIVYDGSMVQVNQKPPPYVEVHSCQAIYGWHLLFHKLH